MNEEVPGSFPSEELNLNKPLSPSQVKENLERVIAKAQEAGCDCEGITPLDIAKQRQAAGLKLLSEILKVSCLESNKSLKALVGRIEGEGQPKGCPCLAGAH